MEKMDNIGLHKVGKHGSIYTDKDERFSKDIVKEIFHLLEAEYPIDKYEYIYYDSLDEASYYNRCNPSLDTKKLNNKIKPDSGVIILRSIYDNNDWYLVLAAEDKNQEKIGNAIERFAKNFYAIYDKVCYGCDIMPYVLCCSGSGLCHEDENLREHIEAKFRQALPFIKNGLPYIWKVTQKHTIFKDGWNLVYTRENRFEYDDKKQILKNVAIKAVEYYRLKLTI